MEISHLGCFALGCVDGLGFGGLFRPPSPRSSVIGVSGVEVTRRGRDLSWPLRAQFPQWVARGISVGSSPLPFCRLVTTQVRVSAPDGLFCPARGPVCARVLGERAHLSPDDRCGFCVTSQSREPPVLISEPTRHAPPRSQDKGPVGFSRGRGFLRPRGVM